MKRGLQYGAILIGTYLVVRHGTRSGRVLRDGARGGRDIIKAFQGR
jgi:hypothetical protein